MHYAKKQRRQDLLLLKRQQTFIEKYKQDVLNEHIAREKAEAALSALQDQRDRAERSALAFKKHADAWKTQSESLQEEVAGLKATLAQIATVNADAAPSTTAMSRP